MQVKVNGPFWPSYTRTMLFEYDVSNNPIYIGMAKPGTASNAPGWSIRKLTYDGANNVTTIKYASGSTDYAFVWDDRASLSYS